MKKSIFIAVALIIFLFACNRVDFVKKITGTWKLSHYIIHNSGNSFTQDKTASFNDSTNVKYQLVINSNYVYNETWLTYTFRADSLIQRDTLGYDTATSTYHILLDTLRFVDTTVTPYAGTGTWQLINSEEDLELLGSGSDTSVRMFNILKLTIHNLNIQNGFKEYDLTK